ncbi:flagellar filament capping protein FliD [Chitinilyticum aquatile]|uniref:flagellar filament capping protein FliD n=1 Tax=Chitinilyticum aquatile TaxID=362520 RepID=UPI0004905C28|nr:flagellar filament capping protein FliD [Chitinilyticum aquatile]
MAITTGGMSGIDINSIVSQLMAIERQPAQKMSVKEVSLQAKISAYGTIKGGLSSFQAALAKLNNVASYVGSTSASSSDDAAVKVSAGSTVQAGKYNIEVTQLASSQKLASKVFTKTSDEVGLGKLTIDFGSYASGEFVQNPSRTGASITIDASNNSLTGMRDAINKANAGVTASIVNDGTGYRLALSSNETGSNSAMRISVDEGGAAAANIDMTGLSAFAYNASSTGTVSNLTQNMAAKDAIFKIDGIAITKPSNTVTDAIDGLTLNLLKETTTGVKVDVSKNAASISAPLKEMVKSYNELISTMRGLTKADVANAKPGESVNAQILSGDYGPRVIESELRSVMNQALDFTGGNLKRLSQVGISIDREGVMKLDESKLSKAMADDPQGVTSLFASNGRIDDPLLKVESLGKTLATGNYALNISRLATQGSYVAAGSVAFDGTGKLAITSGNRSMSLSVDGKAISVDLTQGTYTGAQLAAELQTRINSDASLKAAGSSVSVTIDGSGKLSISSQKYGAASSVTISSSHADLGLSGGVATTGLDVAGTMNGVALKGEGQKLYNDDGFKLQVQGGATGSRGTLAVSQGFAYQLDKAVATMLDSKGTVGTKLDSLNKSVKDVQQQKVVFERRMTALEARYRAQYVALDTMLTQLQQTSSSLTQQLASLPKFQ